MSDFLFDLIVASGERSADMLYATHLNLPDDFIYIGCGNTRAAIVSDLEYDRAKANAMPGLTVRNQNEFGSPCRAVELIGRLQKAYNVKAFRVPYDFPAGLLAQLHNAGIVCRIAEKR